MDDAQSERNLTMLLHPLFSWNAVELDMSLLMLLAVHTPCMLHLLQFPDALCTDTSLRHHYRMLRSYKFPGQHT